MGKEVEKEHAPTVKKILESIKDGKVTMTEEQIFESIAQDHVNEIPDYYTRLKKMEDEAKAGTAPQTKEAWVDSEEDVAAFGDLEQKAITTMK